MNENLRNTWLNAVRSLEISAVGIAPNASPMTWQPYQNAMEMGIPPQLEYLVRNAHCRLDLESIMPGTRSILCCALSLPVFVSETSRHYARFCAIGDYHQVIRERLSALDQILKSFDLIHQSRICVDSAPVLERELAVRAGLGSIGFNRMVIHPDFGSFIALGELFVDADLSLLREELDVCTSHVPHADAETDLLTPGKSHCCPPESRRCIQACPAHALTSNGYDVNRCLSYWSTQHKGDIPEEFASAMDDMLWGCDRCQNACPRNAHLKNDKFADLANPLYSLTFEEILSLSARQIRKKLEGSPIADAHPYMLQRNTCIVIGNLNLTKYTPLLIDITSTHPCDWVRSSANRALALFDAGNSSQIKP